MPWSPHFVFRGRIERDDTYVYAICDEAGVAGHGATAEEALGRLRNGLWVYFGGLCEYGALEDAIKEGKLHLEVPTGNQPPKNSVHMKQDNDIFTATVGPFD